MVAAVSTAVKVFREEPERWRALQLRCMFNDSSWEHAAQNYESVLCEVMADAVQYSKK
jgi:glycogen synthase